MPNKEWIILIYTWFFYLSPPKQTNRTILNILFSIEKPSITWLPGILESDWSVETGLSRFAQARTGNVSERIMQFAFSRATTFPGTFDSHPSRFTTSQRTSPRSYRDWTISKPSATNSVRLTNRADLQNFVKLPIDTWYHEGGTIAIGSKSPTDKSISVSR